MSQGHGRTSQINRGRRFSKRRLIGGTAGLSCAVAILLALPLTSLGSGGLGGALGGLTKLVPQVTNTLTKVVQRTVHPAPVVSSQPQASSSASSSRSSSSRTASSGSPNTPAMYGTNPHGQGSVLGVSLTPSTNVPYPYHQNGQPDTVVLGRGRSEQNPNGKYHAHTTILALLGLALGVDATPGQSNTGPLNAVQTGVLDKICTSLGMLACISVLTADTIASSNGASTHFEVAHVTLAGAAKGVDIGAGESRSSISQTGTCQTASGSSRVTNVNIAGGPLASVAKTSESSTACKGQTPTQTASSSVIGLGGTGVPLPQPGCANGVPNTIFDILGLVRTVCNANSTVQAASPSGVREALTAIVLPAIGVSLAKTVVGQSESHAVAPNSSTKPPGCTDSDKDCGKGPPLTKKCKSYPNDPVDHDGDCDTGYKQGGGGGKKTCPDADGDCGKGGGSCPSDAFDHDGDCTKPGGGSECTDSDADCGVGPPGTGNCTNDTTDNDGDCVAPNGSSETGIASGESTTFVSQEAAKEAAASALPFTGQDVLKVLLVGLLLAGGGLALGLRTRRT